MAKDLYEILGIDEGASPEEVRRAYKRLAQQHHPDREKGDPEEFEQVRSAFAVLGDAQRRARYDAGGATAEPPNIEAMATQMLAQLFSQVVDNEEVVDVMATVRQHIEQEYSNFQENQAVIQRKLKLLDKRQKRMTAKTENNLFDGVVSDKKRAHENALSNLSHNIEINRQVNKMLDDYEYDPEDAEIKHAVFTSATFQAW